MPSPSDIQGYAASWFLSVNSEFQEGGWGKATAKYPTRVDPAGKHSRWPPVATRESPAAVYVDDERTLEATRALQSEGPSLGM